MQRAKDYLPWEMLKNFVMVSIIYNKTKISIKWILTLLYYSLYFICGKTCFLFTYLGLSPTVLYSVMNNLYSEPLSLCYDLAMTKVF